MNRSRIGGDTKFTWLLEACWPKGKHFPFLDSYCTGCFCSHVTKRTILETGCHRHHQGESIYITNFRLIHSIYSSLFFFLHVPTSELIKEVKWEQEVQMSSPFASVSYEIQCQLLPILEEQTRTTQVGSLQTTPTQKIMQISKATWFACTSG